MTAVIIPPDITRGTRTTTLTRIPTTDRPTILRLCAPASGTTTPMVRATIRPGLFTATGINCDARLANASVLRHTKSAGGQLGDFLLSVLKGGAANAVPTSLAVS